MSLEINIIRVGLLQLLCSEIWYPQETKCKNLKDGTPDGKNLDCIDSLKSWQSKNCLNWMEFCHFF